MTYQQRGCRQGLMSCELRDNIEILSRSTVPVDLPVSTGNCGDYIDLGIPTGTSLCIATNACAVTWIGGAAKSK